MKIVAYSIPGCFYCEQLDKLLVQVAKIPYDKLEVGTDIPKEQFKEENPTATAYPYVIIDGEVIGGLTETAKFLYDRGLVSSSKKVKTSR
jgi:glutaredoxin